MRTKTVVAVVALASAALLVTPRPSAAWKPYTHNFSAEQARLDAVVGDDVTIDGRTYTIHPAVAAALRDWPQFFNAGVIGPDGFPDLIYGQSVIHPVDTGRWLQHVYGRAWAAQSDASYSAAEKSQILAFAYGFLTHAAGDMWAHTLVNDFADPGRVQGVFPGVGEILTSVPMAGIAVRHIILEGYIGDATPGFDANPDRALAPGGDVSDDSTPGFAYDAPHRFIYETLINPSASTPVTASRGSYIDARGSIVGFFLEMRDALQDFVNYDPPSLQDSINGYDDTVEALMAVECACNFGAGNCSNSCCPFDICTDFCDGLHDVVACPIALLTVGITAVIDTFEQFLALVADTIVDLALLVLDSYVSAWIDNIDSGLRNWSRLGLATTRGLFDAQARRDLQNDECQFMGGEDGDLRAECEAAVGTLDVVLHQVDPFINDHLLSMMGLPDFVGDVRRIVGEIQDIFEDLLAQILMPLNPLREVLVDIKNWIRDFLVYEIYLLLGIDVEQLGNFLKEPHRWLCLDETPFVFPPPLGPVTLPLFPEGQHDRLDGILQLAPGHHIQDVGLPGPVDCGRLLDHRAYDPAVFATMRNTVTMSKLLLLDGPQVNQVLSDILGRTIETYGPGDNIMTKTLDGSPQWLRLIDGDHSWRQDGLPVFGARVERLTAGTGEFPLWESCVLRPAFRTLFRDWENGLENFPDLGDAESGDPANDPSAPVSTLTHAGAFYDDGIRKFVGADNVFTHTARDGPPGKAFPDDQIELQHRSYTGAPGAFETTGQPASFSLAGADGIWFIDVRSGDHCHTISDADDRPPEATQTHEFVLDTAAPVATGNAPPFGQVFDTDDLSAVSYVLSDGLGSGIASSSATLDGYRTAGGVTPIVNGDPLDMFLLYPGTRTVTISATDPLGQAAVSTFTFEIRATTGSMLSNIVRATAAGLIRNQGLSGSLQAKIEAAAAAAARGQCHTAENVLNAYLQHMAAQRGQGVDAETADRFMAYARDLLARGCGSGGGRGPLGEKAH